MKRSTRRVRGSSGRKGASESCSALKSQRRLLAAIEPLEARMLMAADVPAPALNFQFPEVIPLPAAERPYGPVDLMDVNNDGNQDLVFLGGGSVSVYLGDGAGDFTPAPGDPFKVTGGTGSHTEFYSMQVVNVAPAGKPALDAIIVSEAPRTGTTPGAVTVFLPTATGSLTAMQVITDPTPTPARPRYAEVDSVAIGDVTGDGIPDMVIASKYNRFVEVLQGNGDGTFQTGGETLPVGDQASSVVIADLDGRTTTTSSGQMVPINDIIVADNGDATWSVLINNGPSVLNSNGPTEFAPQLVFPANGVTYNFEVADINGATFPDGQPIPDIIGTGPPANATAANGTFQPGGTVFTQTNAGTGSLQFSNPVGTGAARLDRINVSLNGDGFDGLNVNYFTDQVQPLTGETNGTFRSAGSAYTTVGPDQVTNTDGTIGTSETGYGPVGAVAGYVVNADEKAGYSPDIVVVNHGFDGVIGGTSFSGGAAAIPYGPSITILRPKGNEKFVGDKTNAVGNGVNPGGAATNPPSSLYPNLIAVGDVTGDGVPDIVTVSYDVGPIPATAARPYAIASAYPGTISILLGSRNGSFTQGYSFMDACGPDAVTLANVIGPSSDDEQIIIANRYSGTVQVLNYTAATVSTPGSMSILDTLACPQPLPNTEHPVALAVADLNGDGLPDIVVACYGTQYSKNKLVPNTPGQIVVFLNTGGGNFGGYSQVIADYYGPDAVAIDTFNGMPQLVVASRAKLVEGSNPAPAAGTSPFGKNSISVLEGYNNGTFAVPVAYAPPPITVGLGPSDLAFGNLAPFQYGTEYLAVLNQGDDSLSILKSDGSGGFGIQHVYDFPLFSGNTAKSAAPLSVSIADVNGDGYPDVVLSYGSTYGKYRGGVAVMLNEGPLSNYYLAPPVLIRAPSSGIRMIVNPNTGAITYKAENLPAQAVLATDVNGDGLPDLLVLSASPGKNYDAEVTTILQSQPIVPPTFPSDRNPTSSTFTAGVAGTVTFHVTSTPTSTITATGLPAGLGLTFTDEHDDVAEITGTPKLTAGGKYLVKLTADNGYQPAAQETFTLIIDQAPVITSASHITFTAGKTGTFTVVPTGYPVDVLSEAGALPPGVTFKVNSNGSGTLSASALDANSGGTYTFTFNASNGLLPNASQVFTLTIDQAPAVTAPNPPPQFAVGTFTSFNITTTGFPAPALTETGALPAGVVFTDNGNGTATISGTPSPGTGKVYALTILAVNSTGTASAALALTVGQPPVFTSTAHTATFVAGTSGTFTFTTSSIPAATLTEMGALPAGVSFTSNGDGTATLAGTPAANTGGTYGFMVTASDGTLPNGSVAFTLTVGQAAAFTSANNVTFNAGTARSFTVSTSGFPTANLREAGNLPAGVSFQDNGNGTATISGTPAATGGNAYVISISAVNSIVGTTAQVFTLNVDQPAAITSQNGASFAAGVNGSFTITTSGFPKPALSVLSGSLPAGLTFIDNHNGTATISGAASGNASASTTIVISASNGIGAAATQSFTVTVNLLPVLLNVNGTVYASGTLSGDTVNFSTNSGSLYAVIDSVSASYPLSTVQAVVIGLGNSVGNNTVSIGAGVPTALVSCGIGNDTIVASNNAPDTLQGSGGNDSIRAGSGNDLLQGNAGNDTLIAGSGNQTLIGGQGADSIFGGPGNDLLMGGAGPDTLRGGGEYNTLSGGAGHDNILAGSGHSLLDGGIGTDTIQGGSGDTITDVTPGSEVLHSS